MCPVLCAAVCRAINCNAAVKGSWITHDHPKHSRADGRVTPVQGPSTRIGYTLCTMEHFVGLMMSSCLLGIVFARASIPTARMAFSKVCLITTRSAPQDFFGSQM